MQILLVGSGGREHALCWKLAASPLVERIFAAPGNPGTASVEKTENVAICASEIDALVHFASSAGVDLTVVGPERPLAEGIADRFLERGLRIFGPTKAAARLESSKSFAKQVMAAAGVPTAKYALLDSPQAAKAFLDRTSYPTVLKADGLAAGKGVAVCGTPDEARLFLNGVFQARSVGDAGDRVVAEEYLEGEEVSFFAVCDGRRYIPLAGAADHKRLLEGDLGPNTGGMGAYSPAPILTARLAGRVEREIVQPVLTEMAGRGIPFCGLLYVGLMVTPDGPKVLEFNVRFGDPETQALCPRLKSDLAALLDRASRGQLGESGVEWSDEAALTVVLASEGYPFDSRKGDVVEGIGEAAEGALVFHAGTAAEAGRIVTAGGRVFSVTGTGDTLAKAAEAAYRACDKIRFAGKTFRRDIGGRALGLEEE